MGIPVLTSKGYLVGKLIKKGKCGETVDATNAHKVAEGLETLLQNTNVEKMGK